MSDKMPGTHSPDVSSQPKEQYGEKYNEHLLQQYLLYVQMADKISERRSLANTFFLTANTAILSTLGIVTAILPTNLVESGFLAFLAAITPVLLCYSWYRLVRSYQQLNSGKFTVIHEIEAMLPLAPYRAEWIALGEGKNPARYKPLTDVEKWVPVTFTILYVVVALAALFRGM
jgi:hypothetical protein